jgi:hypothetical protein
MIPRCRLARYGFPLHGEDGVDNNTSKALEPASDPLLTGDGTGSPLFVINLCASMAPVKVPGKALPGLESYRLYQVARVEDGRTRYRLRLGFFSDENEAGMVLASVREHYPTAFTTCLCDEDQKFARGFTPAPARAAAKKAPTAPAPAPALKATPAPAVKAPAPAAPTAAKPAEIAVINELPPIQPKREAEVIELTWMPEDKAAQPVAPVEPKRDEVRIAPSAAAADLKLEAEPVRAQAEPSAPTQSTQPFHVGKGAQIPDVRFEIAGDAKATSTASAAKAQPAQAARPQSKPATTAPTPARPAVTMSPRGLDMELPELDSTQTIRALTRSELEDEGQEKWFSIQLAVSEQPVNLEAMPRLDIFEAYRLYSVATAGSGKITHSLRLGFFREAVSAEAVAGYLKTFFADPTVIRVSVAEQIRFKEPPSRKKTAPSGKSESNVVALNARERHAATVPTVTMEVTPSIDTGATGSFKPGQTGTFKANSTGSFKAQSTASFKAHDTGSFKPNSTGAHRTQVAAKSAVATRSSKATSTGRFKAMPRKSLQEQLLEEAREVELAESGIRKAPKSNSLLARLVGKLTK